MVGTMETKNDFQKTEVGFIPKDWELVSLGQIGNFKNGINKSKEDFGYGSPFVNLLKVFGKNYIDKSIELGLVNANYIDKQLYSLKKGDVIFVRSSVKPSGVGLTILVKEDLPNVVFSGFLIRYRDNGKISNDYKIHCFYEEGFRQRLISNSTVSANTNINQEVLKRLLIALPSTEAEQAAIATVLNDADALITQLEKLIAKKRAIKQGAMQKLLKPKEGWIVKRMGDIFKFLNTANNSRADLAESGEVEYIHYGDIHTRWNCFLDGSKNELPFIDKAKVNSVPFLEDGDLVIADASEDYEGLATCVEIKNIGKRKIVAGLHTLLLRGDKNIIADGFKGYLRNYHGVKDTLIRLSTGVSVFGISKTNLKEVELSIPPTVEEQTHIVQILSDMDAQIEALEKKLDKYKMLKQGMMQTLLTGRIRLV